MMADPGAAEGGGGGRGCGQAGQSSRRGLLGRVGDFFSRPSPDESTSLLGRSNDIISTHASAAWAWLRRPQAMLPVALGVSVCVLLLVALVSVRGVPRGPGSAGQALQGPAIGSPTFPNTHYKEPGCPTLREPPSGRRYIQVKNNCKETIWPGIIPPGAAVPPDKSWAWKAGQCKTLDVPSGLPSLRVWARTGCDESFKCVTGTCIHDGSGACGGAGEAPCSLWEATLQPFCTPRPMVGLGPDFSDLSLVDGYNMAIAAHVTGGYNVGQVEKAYSCEPPVVNPFRFEECPFELRVYSDQIPGTTLPVEGWNGVNQVTSPCFKTPLKADCVSKIVGCRSLCKAMDQGWIGYFIDNAEGDASVINPLLTRPNGERIRWADQFLQGKDKCGPGLCLDSRAWGAYRGSAYAGGGSMKSLVCCDGGFRCSPYQPNDVPGGCPYNQACPTLGASDPLSPFHRQVHDVGYPQADEAVRKSSSYPDWPMPTQGGNYARIYKQSSPSSYSWQFNDASSTYTCCGKENEPGPSYILTFCPD